MAIEKYLLSSRKCKLYIVTGNKYETYVAAVKSQNFTLEDIIRYMNKENNDKSLLDRSGETK